MRLMIQRQFLRDAVAVAMESVFGSPAVKIRHLVAMELLLERELKRIRAAIWASQKQDYPPCIACGEEATSVNGRLHDKKVCAPCFNSGVRSDPEKWRRSP